MSENEPTTTAIATRFDVQELIAQAIDKESGVETIERLLAMAKTVKDERARDAYNEAMAEFQATCPPIYKTVTARIQSQRGGYSYDYAPLGPMLAIVRPVMGPLGLSISWRGRFEANQVIRNCRISHKMGHFEESGELAIPIDQGKADGMGASPAQRVGIADSYAKRYSFIAISGLSPEPREDVDGADDAGAPQEGVQQPRRREGPPPATVEHGSVTKLPALQAGLVVELHAQVAKLEGFQSAPAIQPPWKRWDLHTTNGDKVSTFDPKLADVAQVFQQTAEPVVLGCKGTPKGWGFTSISAADQPPE